MERKRVAFEVKDIDVQAGIFSGHASIFHVPDDGIPPDIMLPGAFAKTIQEWGPAGANRIKILALHRSDWLPIGAPTELTEDETGLFFAGKISDTSLGRDVLTLLRDRVLTEMSIGFDIIKQEPDKTLGVRLLQEVRLWEISPVTWALHPLATIDDVKAIRTLTDRDLYGLESKGSTLAALLNQLIDNRVSDARPRSQMVSALASAADIEAGTVTQILNGDIECPPLNRLEGFAEALSISVDPLRAAAERDGCNYEQKHCAHCGEEPSNSKGTHSSHAAPFAYDPESLQSLKALTAEIQAATATRRIV